MNRRPLYMGLLTLGMLLLFLACTKEIERPEDATATPIPVIESPIPTTTPLPTATPGATAPAPTPTPTVKPTPTSTPLPTATPGATAPIPTPTPTVKPTSTPAPTPVGTPTPEPFQTPGLGGGIGDELFLRITNLPQESVVRTSTIDIGGITTPDAVVSVNGVLIDVTAAGEFAATVVLSEEPNLIEVIASDFRGNRVSAVLTIIYIP